MKKKKNNTTFLQTSSFEQLLYFSSAEQNSKLNTKKMATASFTSCCFSCARHGQRPHMMQVRSSLFEMSSGGRREGFSRYSTADSGYMDEGSEKSSVGLLKRRLVVGSGLCLASGLVLSLPGDGLAVKQGLMAGRIPGLSEPDGNGWRTYRRPDDKSGGHGVGWSPIIPYTFAVPREWEEVPVSIADLGGTEIDLRFASSKEGRLSVVVAPVLRFADLEGNVTIEEIGTPEKVIDAFGPEVLGESVEGKVLSMEVAEHSGRKYYKFELEPPHIFITATAAGNRLYLFNVTASGLQWKRHVKDLKRIADSFRVV